MSVKKNLLIYIPQCYLYKTEEDKYIITFKFPIISGERLLGKNQQFITDPEGGYVFNKAIKKLQSYDFQKKFLTEHPERANIIRDFGFHPNIKKEFPKLVIGSEWGFFNLKND